MIVADFRKQVLRKLKNEFSFSNLMKRDLTIGDVAHAQQSESTLSLPSLKRNIALRFALSRDVGTVFA